VKQLKKKKCKICKTEFIPFNSLTKVCSSQCAYEFVQKENLRKTRKDEKAQRKQHREAKNSLKSRSDWLREAQTVFNAYIRARDRGQPCISCKTEKPDIQFCAGHYLTRGGHPELRFSELNTNLQCNQYCNMRLSGNIRLYRINLIEKIGLKNVEWLEGRHEPQKWTIEEIKEIKLYYRDKLKALEND